ncbi:hypothetical protein RJT34_07226 [Clitoria ternatea]|uniref:Uncharacterized protein n=1 Tax=Clitoria ternatea TaxID=43366 RepID=A0AAN9K389_CLITE
MHVMRFLDKAAIVEEKHDEKKESPWRLATVTRVEETKLILNVIPIWLTSSMVGLQNPPASMVSISAISSIIVIPMYDMIIVPILRKLTGAFKARFDAPLYEVDAVGSTVPQADYIWRIIMMVGELPAALTYYWRMKMPETACYTALVAKNIEQAAADISKVLQVKIQAEPRKEEPKNKDKTKADVGYPEGIGVKNALIVLGVVNMVFSLHSWCMRQRENLWKRCQRKSIGINKLKTGSSLSISVTSDLKQGAVECDSEGNGMTFQKDIKPGMLTKDEAAIKSTSIKLSMALKEKAKAEELLAELENVESPQEE